MPDGDEKQSAPAPKTAASAQRPRDAATLVIVDTSTGDPRVLMGRRHANQVFLPGMYVFPGGRVDRADYFAPAADALDPAEISLLLKGMKGAPSPARARALALAAIRETFEEAGLVIGAAAKADRPAAASGPWSQFLATGHQPAIGHLSLFARAITPPGRPRRYDTRFFATEATAIAQRLELRDGELENLEWFTFEDARNLDLPAITRVVVEDLEERLKIGLKTRPRPPVPFYFYRNGTFERALLSQDAALP